MVWWLVAILGEGMQHVQRVAGLHPKMRTETVVAMAGGGGAELSLPITMGFLAARVAGTRIGAAITIWATAKASTAIY